MSTLNLIIALSSPSIIQSAKVQYIPIKKERLRINKDRSREREREREKNGFGKQFEKFAITVN